MDTNTAVAEEEVEADSPFFKRISGDITDNFELEEDKLWERVFYHPDEELGYLKARPEPRTPADNDEIKHYFDLIRKEHPEGFISYDFHRHGNGHFEHNLFITFHGAGYRDLKEAGVLY